MIRCSIQTSQSVNSVDPHQGKYFSRMSGVPECILPTLAGDVSGMLFVRMCQPLCVARLMKMKCFHPAVLDYNRKVREPCRHLQLVIVTPLLFVICSITMVFLSCLCSVDNNQKQMTQSMVSLASSIWQLKNI